MNYTLEELKSKPKQELVQIALEILQEKESSLIIHPEDFKIVVYANNQDIFANFKRNVTFVPMKNRISSVYQYDLSVSILQNSISTSSFLGGSGHNTFKEDSLFVL